MEVLKSDMQKLTLRDLFAKYSENKIVVFIIPKIEIEIVLEESIQRITKKLGIDIQDIMESDVFVKEFNNIDDARKYVMNFRGEWLNYFTVECYHNGNFITENT
jgi:hypothetical protein